MKRGLSLVELVIMSALGAVVLGAIYLLFSAGSRQGSQMEKRLRSVQASQILLEYLASDLKAAHVGTSYPIRVESIAGARKNRLTFFVHDRNSDDGGDLPITRRVYLYDPVTHGVTRDGVSISFPIFSEVRFLWKPASTEGSPALEGDTLTVVITAAPSDKLDSGDELEARDLTTFVETVTVTPYRKTAALRWWTPNSRTVRVR